MSWRDQAACRTHGPDKFDIGPPTKVKHRAERRSRKANKALAICHTCPALQPCRDDALRAGYWGMVAGGLLPEHQGPRDWIRGLVIQNDDSEYDFEHGTRAGYLVHWRRGERPCRPCTNAATQYNQQRRKKTS